MGQTTVNLTSWKNYKLKTQNKQKKKKATTTTIKTK